MQGKPGAGAFACRATLLALTALRLSAQSSVGVYAPQPALISGQQAQLQATALDANGGALPNNNFTWTSNHPEWVSVDSKGVATANGLGIADITVALGNLRATVRLQSLPLAVGVNPTNLTMQIGQTQQFSATAVDINGNPIPGVTFVWSLDGDNGGLSIAGSIDSNGLFTAIAVANFTVRAIVYYPGYPGDFVSQVFGTASLRIQPIHDYKLTRLLSTSSVRSGLHLRQRRNTIAGNDAGQVAMTASLDGLTSGLVRYDGTGVNLLLGGGIPGLVQGGPVWDYSDPAVNANGDILSRADEMGAGSSLLLWQSGQVTTVHLDGQATQSSTGLTDSDTITRYSLNDSGDFVFRANWRPNNTVPSVTAYYRSTGGNLNVDRLATDPLPGLASPVTLNAALGLDNAWNFWFTATDGKNTGVFREDISGSVIRILMTGDSLAGAQVTSVNQLGVQAATGDVVVTGNTNKGSFAARWSGANTGAAPVVFIGNNMDLQSFNGGGPVFQGYGDSGLGLYTLTKAGLRKLLLYGALAPSGEPITAFQSSILLSNGDLIAYVSTPSQPMTVIRTGSQKATLFSAGALIDGVVNLALRDVVPGAKTGPAHITMGGNNTSLMAADKSGTSQALVTGDSLPGGWPFYGSYQNRKGPDGTLYVTIDQALYKIAGGTPTILSRFNQTCETGVTCFAPSVVSVNDNGQVAGIMNSTANQRIGILDGTTFRILLRVSDAVPGMGRVTSFNINEFALDANGRIMAWVNTSNGSGYAVYSGGSWSSVAVINTTDLGGIVIGASNLRVAGGRFYALLTLSNGNFFIASWDGQWNPLISRNAPSPDGNNISGINGFDVNHNGDIALVANLNGTTSIMVQTGGVTKMVYFGSETAAPDFWVRAINSTLDFRDDRRLYFAAWSLADEYALFVAEPGN
jgi:hypothetical protein